MVRLCMFRSSRLPSFSLFSFANSPEQQADPVLNLHTYVANFLPFPLIVSIDVCTQDHGSYQSRPYPLRRCGSDTSATMAFRMYETLDSASIDYSVLDDYWHSICMTTSTYAMYGSIVDLTDLDTFSRSNHGLIFWRECIVLDKGERIHNDVSLFH